MNDNRLIKLPITVPEECATIERQYQLRMYVENRVSDLQKLKHDTSELRNLFLSFLTPPEVQQGFSDRINILSQQVLTLQSEKTALTSERDRLKRDIIHVHIDCNRNHYDEPREEAAINNNDTTPGRIQIVCYLFIAILLFLLGAFTGSRYFPGFVESKPVGIEHSIKGGTINGEIHQPQQGSSPQGQSNRRVQKAVP